MERHHVLEGCLNLRDLGGYRTDDGRTVRWGCVFRSGELCSLTTADLETIDRLGIRVVVDLRSGQERSDRPNRLPDGVELIERRSASTTEGRTATLEEHIAARDVPPRADDRYVGHYIRLLERLAPEIRVVLERALHAADRPILFHCAAGKDRTGVVAAVLLGLLGVPEEAIVADFELTNEHYAPRRLDALAALMADHEVTEDDVRHHLEARTPALRGCLAHLHGEHGGFDRFAISVAGVPPDLPDLLRDALTTAR